MQRIIIIDDSDCKPLLEDFLRMLRRHVQFEMAIGNEPLQQQLLLKCIKDLPAQRKIPVNSGGNIHLVIGASILRVEACQAASFLQFADGRVLLTEENIDHWQEKLKDAGVLRVHRNHLVGIAYIERMQLGDNPSLTLTNGEKIPVDLLTQQQIAWNIEEML